MLFQEGRPSQFYQSYVKDIQAKIAENAAAEFSCIWREHQRLQGAKARTIISDELSSTLNNLQAELERSDLFDDVPSRLGVMRRAIPKTLVDKIGLDTLMERLPGPYQRALFSSWVSSHFVSTLPTLGTQCAHTSEFPLADLQVRCSGLQRRLSPFRSGPCEVNRWLYYFVKGKKGPLEAKTGYAKHRYRRISDRSRCS
jgi:hypothetical protein